MVPRGPLIHAATPGRPPRGEREIYFQPTHKISPTPETPMTTLVTIINHGPDDILVETLNSKNPAEFLAVTGVILSPKTLAECYVHDDQRLAIAERKKPEGTTP